jgi:hypothetical protein
MRAGRLISRYGPSVARGLRAAPGRAARFSGMGKTGAIAAGAYFGYKGIKGFTDQVVPNTINNTMDVAFGDPNADNMVLGTDLSPSMMYMNSGLPGRNIARGMNVARTGVNTGPVGAALPPLFFRRSWSRCWQNDGRQNWCCSWWAFRWSIWYCNNSK